MYTASFGLRCHAFEDRADAAFFFPAAGYEEAIAAMQYEAQHGSGVGLVLGETGTGKTILVRALTRRLTDSEKVVVLTVPVNGALDILREVCKGFGVSLPSSPQDARGLARLRRHLSRTVREGSRPILIIDQAEHLSPGDLSDVESLLEMQDDRGRLLRIVLAAHPRFCSLIEQPAFGRLRQLAFAEHRLSSLSETEVAQYIRHRLSVAGAAGTDIFSNEAIAAVFERSQGIPRVINQVCTAAMLAAYGEGEPRIDPRHVEGFQQLAGAVLGSSAMDEFDYAPTRDQSREFESAISHDQRRQFATDIDVTESQLANLIQQADRAAAGLKRRMPQAAQAVDQVEGRVEQLLSEARGRIHTLESRLAAATRRAEQAAAQVERAEHAFARAEQIESRLTAFADELAEQMDHVQTRVTEIMNYAAPLDDARNRLDSAVQQSDSARERIEQAITRGHALLVERSEKSLKDLQESISALMGDSSKKMRNSFEATQKETSCLLEKTDRSIKSMTAESQHRATQMAQTAQGQIEAATRAAAEKVALAENKITEMQDAVQAGQLSIQDAAHKALRTADDLKQAGDQAKQEIQSAQEAANRIRTLHIESSQASARIGADTAAARQMSESLGVLISGADVKIAQMASSQAALTHLHDRLSRMLLTAHPLMERADETFGQLGEQLTQSDKARTQLGEKVTEITAHIERANQTAAHAGHQTKSHQDAAQAAAKISQKLETTQEQASRNIVWLQEYVAKSSTCLSQMESLSAALGVADQTSDRLAAIVSSGTSLLRDIPALLDSTRNQQSSLVAISDKARGESQEASAKMSGHLQLFHDTLQKSEGDLAEYHRRVGALEAEFQLIGERVGAAQKVAMQVQGVVENAQNQSENLERVCVAVRKVFSGLSQASLNARNQALELEQFVTHANQTAGSFQQWLERVRVRLDGIMEVPTDRSAGRHSNTNDGRSEMLEREAEMLVEHEPGAANAHLVEGGLDVVPTQPYPSQAREIAQLIEKARKSKTADTDMERAGQPAC